MTLIGRGPTGEILQSDIDSLVSTGFPEGRHLDYKEHLPNLDSRDEVQELLRDVCAFANAGGGTILYGVSEERDNTGQPSGTPKAVCPVPCENPDKLSLRLHGIIRGNLDPVVVGLIISFVAFGDNYVIAVRVPPSIASPHMITQGVSSRTNSRFYYRHGNGKQPMDVSELRRAFVRSQGQLDGLQRLREARFARLLEDDSPMELEANGRLLLLMVPVRAMALEPIDVEIDPPSLKRTLEPIRAAGWSSRYNFDGYISWTHGKLPGVVSSYTQLFHNGTIEAAAADLIVRRRDETFFPAGSVAIDVVGGVSRYLAVQRSLGVEPPIYVSLALTGLVVTKIRSDAWDSGQTLERNDLVLREVVVSSFDESIPMVLQPCLDRIWQAYGLPKCNLYDRGGPYAPSDDASRPTTR